MNMPFWDREYFSKDAVKVSAPQWLWIGFYQGFADMHTHGKNWVWNSPVQIGLKQAWKKTLFNIFVTRVYLTVCFYDVTYTFQSKPTLYSSLNVNEHLAQNRHGKPLQSLGFIFDHIFGPKKDYLFCTVFVFPGIWKGEGGLKHFMNIPVQFHSST